jgi:hypothetical protein
MLKKTITYYLQNSKNVNQLINKLQKIKDNMEIKGPGGTKSEKFKGVFEKSWGVNQDDTNDDEDVNEKRRMMKIVSREMDDSSSDYSQEEIQEAARGAFTDDDDEDDEDDD